MAFRRTVGEGRRGIAAVAFAALIVFDASLAPGLHNSGDPTDMNDEMPMPRLAAERRRVTECPIDTRDPVQP